MSDTATHQNETDYDAGFTHGRSVKERGWNESDADDARRIACRDREDQDAYDEGFWNAYNARP